MRSCPFIHNRTDGMAVIAMAQAVEDHLGDRHLTLCALATSLIVENFGEATVLRQKLRHRDIGGRTRRGIYCGRRCQAEAGTLTGTMAGFVFVADGGKATAG